MYKLLHMLAFCFLIAISTNAQYSLTVSNPHFNVNQRTQGIITSPEITVTPNGAYAKVEMTFIINPQSSYKSTDSLEAVMNFDLPAGSFIHDSWLWLNETVIIRAAVVEKNRAVAIYENIVQRRRDPSLLYKTGDNSYQLHVYPMTTTYPRKLKLTYLTPLKWQDDRASMELPVQFFATSQMMPDVLVKIKHDFYYSSPAFTDQNYSQYFVGTNNGEDAVLLRGTDYANKSFNLTYTIGNTGMQLYTYPINANEGVYQLIVPPTSFGVNKSLNTVFILDHPVTTNSIHTLEQVKQQLKSALLSNYSSKDSFNIFYEKDGNIVQAFTNWQQINQSSVASAINAIPAVISNTAAKYEDLLKSAMAFCSTKNSIDAQAVLLSNNYNYTVNQNSVDALFNSIKAHLGGKWPNKLQVVNYSSYKTTISGVQHNANDIWYTKVSTATGGSLYKFYKSTSTYINNKYVYTYDLNMGNTLSAIADNSGISTSAYNININVANGFAFSPYNLHPVDRLNMSKHYVETGKYTGSMGLGTVVNMQAVSGNNYMQFTDTVNNVANGDATLVPAWAHHFINDLIAQNNTAYLQEIIDSSIRNRVLCEYTAFLAVENGDTINTNIDDNMNVVWLTVDEYKKGKDVSVKCFPNPFSHQLTIEFNKDVELVEVYDMMGRKVFSQKVSSNKQSIVWNGKDSSGNELPSGMYMIVASTATERFTTKVMKQ